MTSHTVIHQVIFTFRETVTDEEIEDLNYASVDDYMDFHMNEIWPLDLVNEQIDNDADWDAQITSEELIVVDNDLT